MDQKRQTVLQFCPCSQRCASGSQPSPTGALSCCVYTSGSQPSPTALSVQSAVFSLSNRSSVRAVCGVYTSGSQPSPTGALSVQSAVFTPPAHSHLQPELCPCSLRCLAAGPPAHSHLQPELCPCSLRCSYTSGSQPSPTGALSVQSAVFTPPAHSHLQPELCPCSLRCLHLRLTAISNRSSVRAVCDVPRVVIG